MSENRKQKVTARKLFPRKQRAPLAVQDKASLWLDLYVDFATILLGVPADEKETRTGLVEVVEDASLMADMSLDAYEERWPTAEVPGRD